MGDFELTVDCVENVRRVELFKESVNYFQKELNLLIWEITVDKMTEDSDDNRATVYYNFTSYQASIFYSESWISSYELLDDEIHKVAFHECCEIMFGKIADNLHLNLNSNRVFELIHEQIRLLENILLPHISNKEIKQ